MENNFTFHLLDVLLNSIRDRGFIKNEQEKYEPDKFRVIYIIESLTRIKDKRALSYLGPLLESSDVEIKNLAINAFDIIEPNWKEIIERERNKPIQDIFKVNL